MCACGPAMSDNSGATPVRLYFPTGTVLAISLHRVFALCTIVLAPVRLYFPTGTIVVMSSRL